MKLLICDLDNTLYDWVAYFVPSFYAMLDEAVRVTNCDREKLLDDFRSVHIKHHDSEHPFSLLETDTMKEIFRGMDRKCMANKLDSAFYAFNSQRIKNLRLYPGVRETLDVLVDSGVKLVAHTESRLYAALDRLNRLEIAHKFAAVYCRERPQSEHPNSIEGDAWIRNFPVIRSRELSQHQRKPDPSVIREICGDVGVRVDSTSYVGDSMSRDMLMAKNAGVFAIWAEYGTRNSDQYYRKLIRVSHWTADDVERERILKEQSSAVRVDFILKNSFREILDALRMRES